MSCCNNSRFLSSGANTLGNVRYKYIDMPPLATGISLSLVKLGSKHNMVWYSDDIKITIQKKGCASDCEKALEYTATEINQDTKVATFAFDEEFFKLCRGRYEAIVTIGCYDLVCRLDFSIGQSICIGDADISFTEETDGSEYTDPNCCNICEKPKPCPCRSNLNSHNICGDSLDSCAPMNIEIDLLISDKEHEALDAWIAEKDGSC